MGEVQADQFWPAPASGEPLLSAPTICTGPLPAAEGVGEKHREGAWAASLSLPAGSGVPSSLQDSEKLPQGRYQARESRKVRPPFLPGPPSRQGGHIPSAHPCHPDFYSGQELGINLIRDRPWR